MTCFSDILGNRLDLYDRVAWFDDVMHFVCTGLLGAAAILLVGGTAGLRDRLQVAVAWGMTFAVAWELFEYLAFVARSAERGTAYADTVGDLVLGWSGTVVAALLVRGGGKAVDRRAPAGVHPDDEDRMLG